MGHVPPELAIHILSFLTDPELALAASVCRYAYKRPVECVSCVRV
jgi:hypothetical protein